MGLIKDQMLAAFKKAGVDLLKPKNGKQANNVQVTYGTSKFLDKKKNQPPAPRKAPNKSRSGQEPKSSQTSINRKAIDLDARLNRDAVPAPKKVSIPDKSSKDSPALPSNITLIGIPQYRFRIDKSDNSSLIKLPVEIGLKTQLGPDGNGNAHDVTIGFDFGTSAVKAVVGDATIDKYFAVPFREGIGINRYLLPSRLWELHDTWDPIYSLVSGQRAHRDIKLSLLADPNNKSNQVHAVAFFALVFQRIRSWLFTEHGEIYTFAEIYWNLAIGIPSESHVDNALTPIFKRLITLAWRISTDDEVRTSRITSILEERGSPELDVEVSVIPEIAAQIFGFVSSPSSSFDKNRANRYAIVDIGAGTVDSSVFEVRQKNGLWNFTYYTAVVEPNGVANLHAHRVDWWINTLKKFDEVGQAVEDLSSDKYSTDIQAPVPATFADYVGNVSISSSIDKSLDPDAFFFTKRLIRQVKGHTIWRCWDKQLLEKTDITGMPIFVCGGGARMAFYADLINEMPKTEGATWISLSHWILSRPSDLICNEVSDSDYDRLSVAYGLSRLHLGSIDTAQPLAKDPNRGVATWQDRYIDKDQV